MATTSNDRNEQHDNQVSRGPDRRQNPGGALPEGSIVDRRLGLARRTDDTGLERKRGPGRRLSEFTRAAEEGEMTPEQFLFLIAIDEFKRVNDKPYPTWSDVLEVVRLLGYRKTVSSELNLTRAEDWTEQADAPSGVRPDNWADRASRDTGKRARLDEAQLAAQASAAGEYDADAGDDTGDDNLAAYDIDLDDFEDGLDYDDLADAA